MSSEEPTTTSDNNTPHPKRIYKWFWVGVILIMGAWVLYGRYWVSAEERHLLSYLGSEFAQSDTANFEEYLDVSWDKVCVLKEYDGTNKDSLGRAPEEIKSLDWSEYEGMYPDLRPSISSRFG